eukprot:scaffold619414_cov19-Prasinocladus_malaysianus.AAC.1
MKHLILKMFALLNGKGGLMNPRYLNAPKAEILLEIEVSQCHKRHKYIKFHFNVLQGYNDGIMNILMNF